MNYLAHITDRTKENMSYIPSWVTGGGAGHYPAHMLPPQHALSPHTQHTPVSSALQHPPTTSPHSVVSSESHLYQPLSPKSLVSSTLQAAAINNTTKSEHHHHHLSQSAPSPSSPVTPVPSIISNSLSQSQAPRSQQHPPPSSTPSQSPASTTTPSHVSIPLESPYEPQGFHRNETSPPPKLHPSDIRHDLASQLHSLPELALGIPGTSANTDMKAHRKYVRSLVGPRSPGKHPAPEQLAVPVMYSYQGRGRPRKHWTHGTGLPTMLPITHPSTNHNDDDEENKPFKCNVCGKGFKLRSGLQQHERTHSSDRPYVCPDCGKLFRQPTHLQQHMRIHTGEKPYDCTFCDKSFRQRTILNQHLRIHTGEKPYVCMECGKQFRQKAILDQHYRTHLGDKPFACPHPACRKHFREMATLISHMKCHKDVPDPKIVLQQAKKLIKEEQDDYSSPDGLSLENLTRPHHIGGLHSLVNHSQAPHGLGGQPTHNGPPQGILSVGHNQNLQSSGLQHDAPNTNGNTPHRPHALNDTNSRYHSESALDIRTYSSPGSNNSQKSPHSLHGHSPNTNHTNGNTANTNGNSTSNSTPNSTPNGSSAPSNAEPPHPNQSVAMSAGGMMAATSSHMAMANLLPYPHSIFPAAAAQYMMSSQASDPRQYHQLTVQTSQASLRPTQ